MPTLVDYACRDGVATVTMHDGKANALSFEMFWQLHRALDRAAADDAALVLTGHTGVFSAGFDLAVLRAGDVQAAALVRTGFELGERLLAFPRPVVVACSGHAVAMGVFLLLAGDYRIGAEGDWRIGQNEVAIGLTMPRFAIEICRQRLTPPAFNRALICAEPFSGEAAVAAGFLDRVVPAAELARTAHEVARTVAFLDREAHRATKQRVREPVLRAVRAAIEADDAAFHEQIFAPRSAEATARAA